MARRFLNIFGPKPAKGAVPDRSDAVSFYKRGNIHKDHGEVQEALASYDQAIALDPCYAIAYCNRGVVLALLNRPHDALASYDRTIDLNPTDALAHYNRGAVLRELGRWSDALASYDQAIKIRPDYAEAYCNRGILLQRRKAWDAALTSYDQSIKIYSGFSQAHFNRGNLLRETKQLDAALASYDRAIEIDPEYADAYCNRGVVLNELRRWDDAFASFNRAIELRPEFAEAFNNLGLLLAQVMRLDAAIESYDAAIARKPDYPDALCNRAAALLLLKRYSEGIASYDQAMLLKQDYRFLLGMRRHAKMYICDWDALESDLRQLTVGIENDEAVSPPFPVLALLNSAQLQHKVAQLWIREEHPAEPKFTAIPRQIARDKIHLGYFSADFYDHPVAVLAAEFIETHDRSRFEVTAFSFGPETQDPVRKRIQRACDLFIDVKGKSDQDIASLARSLKIDIAIDLGGHTGNSRPRVFALRAAPIQINYLGYPGTMGAAYIDYLLADRIVVPEAQQPHYSEKIIYLPNSYLPHDSSRAIADKVFGREELGLPAVGVVFCAFNGSYKITPGTFGSWMRILERVAGSVLWLSENNSTAAGNLRQEALRRGVEVERLIFADRTASLPEHLARHRAADLFLDTLPYNAHATALDALWSGLPVLTCTGEGFAGRVAASLLTAVDLPELITSTAEEYENLAVELATNPQHLTHLKLKLAQNRRNSPLFNTTLFTRHLEAAYVAVHGRYRADLPPEHIYVDA